jgi:Putative prokaryotic signal transducing protein
LSRALVCPVCDAAHEPDERFCDTCGLPLVYAPGDGVIRTSSLADRARKVQARYVEGPLVGVAAARHQAEAEMIQELLLEEGIPSLVRRSGGFDVPDFLAAGPRDILVAASADEAAREILGDRREEHHLPPQRYPTWVRALAVTLSVVVLAAFAGSVLLPLT